MDMIEIKGLEVFAKHGVYPEENALGQKFVISVKMALSTRKAGKSDDLDASVNYGEVCRHLSDYAAAHTYKLIERLAEELAHEVLVRYPLVKEVTVRVEKPWAPVGLPIETVAVEISRSRHTVYIAFGSNMGNREEILKKAISSLNEAEDCSVVTVSDFLETEPYGYTDQDLFLNGVLELSTLLTPEELLEKLHGIEAEAGRKRVIRWGPRTLDLDIIFYDDAVIDTKTLHIPHIDLHQRDFVLIPMKQIAPWFRHPVLNLTIEELWDKLQQSGAEKSDPETV